MKTLRTLRLLTAVVAACSAAAVVGCGTATAPVAKPAPKVSTEVSTLLTAAGKRGMQALAWETAQRFHAKEERGGL